MKNSYHIYQPSADKIPDEFLIDSENLGFLIRTLDKENAENWYAFYQAGLGCFQKEEYEKAKAFFYRSWEIEENPWACHGTACVCRLLEQDKEAVQWVLRGLKMENKNVSFLKESFTLLFLCNADLEIIDFIEHQNPEAQKIGKLEFYYISALHRTGEDSIAWLWSELYENLYAEKAPIPYRYDFKAF